MVLILVAAILGAIYMADKEQGMASFWAAVAAAAGFTLALQAEKEAKKREALREEREWARRRLCPELSVEACNDLAELAKRYRAATRNPSWDTTDIAAWHKLYERLPDEVRARVQPPPRDIDNTWQAQFQVRSDHIEAFLKQQASLRTLANL